MQEAGPTVSFLPWPLANSEQNFEAEKMRAASAAVQRTIMSAAKTKPGRRPFRVPLDGAVLVLMRLPNGRQMLAPLHTLSTTGGAIQLEKPLDEKVEVELLFHVDRATIRCQGEMLFPMWAKREWIQPFRFTDLPEDHRKMLETNLKSFMEKL